MAISLPSRAGERAAAPRSSAAPPPATGAGAPSAALAAQVVRREVAAEGAVTLWLAAPGTQYAPALYAPGQFITLFLPAANGTTFSRSYSLCGDGRADQPWEITIKRQEGGLVSPYLCERILPGMVLRASAPSGTFALPRAVRPDETLIFVATGSGITPFVGMLRALARLDLAARPQVRLHYAYRSPAEAIYGAELSRIDPDARWLRLFHYAASAGARLTPERVYAAAGSAALAARWYICGTPSLKDELVALLAHQGVERQRIHLETYASPRRAPTGAATGRRRGRARPTWRAFAWPRPARRSTRGRARRSSRRSNAAATRRPIAAARGRAAPASCSCSPATCAGRRVRA